MNQLLHSEKVSWKYMWIHIKRDKVVISFAKDSSDAFQEKSPFQTKKAGKMF